MLKNLYKHFKKAGYQFKKKNAVQKWCCFQQFKKEEKINPIQISFQSNLINLIKFHINTHKKQLSFYSTLNNTNQIKQQANQQCNSQNSKQQNSSKHFFNDNFQNKAYFSDDFLQSLMNNNFNKDSIIKVANTLFHNFQQQKNVQLQNQQGKNVQIQNQKLNKSQNTSLIKIKFLAYCYNIYPAKVNVILSDQMISEFFKNELQNTDYQQQFSTLNKLEDYLKIFYQSQFYKGNYQNIKHSLAIYNQFLVKISQLLLKEFNLFEQKTQLTQISQLLLKEFNLFEQKTQLTLKQEKAKLQKLTYIYKKIVFLFPFLKIQSSKQTIQQNQLIILLNQPYLKIVNNFITMIKCLNTFWINSQFSQTSIQKEVSLKKIKQNFKKQFAIAYKHINQTLSIVVQNQEQKLKFFNLNKNQKMKQNNKKNLYQNYNIIDFDFFMIFDENILKCQNQVKFIKILCLLQQFICFNLFRKIHLKKVNQFYKHLFKINMNQNFRQKGGKNQKNFMFSQKMKTIIWNHLSKNALYLNFQVVEYLKDYQLRSN